MSVIKVDWACLCLGEMSSDQLFEVLRMRQNIFIIEQSCIYPDIDKHVESIIKYNVPIVFTSAGSPKKYTQILKENSITVVHVVANQKFALK